MRDFRRFLQDGNVLVFDGGMGSLLQRRGLRPGQSPEEFGMARPDVVAAIHAEYAHAGALVGTTNPFGATCNRLRITSNGELRTCLFSDRTYRLRPALRHPALGLKAAERILRLALRRKPVGAELLAARSAGLNVSATAMSAIGG